MYMHTHPQIYHFSVYSCFCEYFKSNPLNSLHCEGLTGIGAVKVCIQHYCLLERDSLSTVSFLWAMLRFSLL